MSTLLLDSRPKDFEADADADDETNEAYDSFDIFIGFKVSRSSIDSSRKPGSLLIRGPYSRAQSVESTDSSVTTDLFITTSQAASPGASTSYTELTECQETRLSHLLDTKPATSPAPPAPNSAEQTVSSYVRPPNATQQGALPSFDTFLQSVGQLRSSSTLPLKQESEADHVLAKADLDDHGLAPSAAPSLLGSTLRSSGPLRIQRADSLSVNTKEPLRKQLASITPSSIDSYPLPVGISPKFSTCPPTQETVNQTPIDAAYSYSCVGTTTAQSLKTPPATPSRTNIILPTGNGDDHARPGFMSTWNPVGSPLRPHYLATSLPKESTLAEHEHYPKRRRTSQGRARHSAPRQKHTSSLSQESILDMTRQPTARTVNGSPRSSPLVPHLSLEAEEGSNKVPRLSRAHEYIRGASALSVSWTGTESPPTTPDHLLLDLGEDWESDSHDEVELARLDENSGK